MISSVGRSAISSIRISLNSYNNVILHQSPCYRYLHVGSMLRTSLVIEDVAMRNERNMQEVNFKDFKKAFRLHSTWEIAKSLFIFRLCSYRIIVDNSLWLMDMGRKILGRQLFNAVMKSTFHGQFVAGETLEDMLTKIKQMQTAGIGPMLCVPIEEDIGETGDRELKFDNNLSTIMSCIRLTKEVDTEFPMSQIKLTALVPADLCCRLSELVPNPIAVPERVDEVVNYLKSEEGNFEYLNDAETVTMKNALKRLKTIGELSASSEVRLVIDAEYTYMNPALRLFSIALMLIHNKYTPLVAYTYQNYLKVTYDEMVEDETFVGSRGCCFGAKLVRGAYMEKERRLANSAGVPDPVNESFQDTSRMYEKSMDYLLEKSAIGMDKYFVMVASHNERSVTHALQRMKNLGMSSNNGTIFFGQVYGMCDYISYTLGMSGHNIYKSIPYGSVEDTLPYLYRRALENSSILGGTQAERRMLWRVLVNRITCGLVYKCKEN